MDGREPDKGGNHVRSWLRLLTERGNGPQCLFPRSIVLPLLAVLTLVPGSVHSGAWTRERGESYFKGTSSLFRSNEVFDPKGTKKLPAPDFTDASFYLYAEHGFTPLWTGVLSVGAKSLAFDAPGGRSTESGLSDAWFHAKRRLLVRPVVVSAQAGVKVPLGYGGSRVPPLGQGQVDWESRLLVGRSFHPFPAYAGAEFGYRRRNGPYSDELPYRFEAGLFLGKKAMLKLALDGIDNRVNDAAGDIATFATRPPNVFDQEYLKFGPALLFFLPGGWAAEAAWETVLDGGNTAAGNGYSLGIAWQGKL